MAACQKKILHFLKVFFWGVWGRGAWFSHVRERLCLCKYLVNELSIHDMTEKILTWKEVQCIRRQCHVNICWKEITMYMLLTILPFTQCWNHIFYTWGGGIMVCNVELNQIILIKLTPQLIMEPFLSKQARDIHYKGEYLKLTRFWQP